MHDRENDSTDHPDHHANEEHPRRAGAPSPPPGGEERVGEKEGGSSQPPNAFDRDFLDTFSRRDPAPATPEADNAGPWRVTRLHGAGDPRWACIAAGERPPRFSFREPDLAHLTNAGLELADRPPRFRFQVDAPHGGQATLHLLHDGFPVGIAGPSTRESEQLPMVLTALANLRVRPEALAHFLLAVPDEVLRRCGVILAAMAGSG